MILKFGKFKGQQFENTPKWYQDWLLKQDWFESPKNKKARFSVIEGGYTVHTTDLTEQEAIDTVNRMRRIFDDIQWHYEPMNEFNSVEAKGLMQRQRDIAVRYNQP